MNGKLKKEQEKGILKEIERIRKEMEVLEPSSDEYEKLAKRLIDLYKSVTDDGQNEVKLKSVVLDNIGGFVGVVLSMTLSIVLGQIPSPHANLFSKMKMKH